MDFSLVTLEMYRFKFFLHLLKNTFQGHFPSVLVCLFIYFIPCIEQGRGDTLRALHSINISLEMGLKTSSRCWCAWWATKHARNCHRQSNWLCNHPVRILRSNCELGLPSTKGTGNARYRVAFRYLYAIAVRLTLYLYYISLIAALDNNNISKF